MAPWAKVAILHLPTTSSSLAVGHCYMGCHRCQSWRMRGHVHPTAASADWHIAPGSAGPSAPSVGCRTGPIPGWCRAEQALAAAAEAVGHCHMRCHRWQSWHMRGHIRPTAASADWHTAPGSLGPSVPSAGCHAGPIAGRADPISGWCRAVAAEAMAAALMAVEAMAAALMAVETMAACLAFQRRHQLASTSRLAEGPWWDHEWAARRLAPTTNGQPDSLAEWPRRPR